MAYGIVLTNLNPYIVGAIYFVTTLLVSGAYYLIIKGLTRANVEEYWQRIE